MDKIQMAKNIFDIEIEALQQTKDALGSSFVDILEIIMNCKGKIIVTGMGKSGHIARKIAATFSSLGTSSFYLHPAEAMHGDLGMIEKIDAVIAISYSGESNEIINIIPTIKLIGATLIGITGKKESFLAKNSDVVQILPDFREACNMGLAPTSSTTVTLCYGDALAVVISKLQGFGEKDFGKFHPAGALGKKLILKVEDLMASYNENAIVLEDSTLKDAIVELSKKGLGIVNVINTEGILLGVITDGDLRRQLEKDVDVYNLNVLDIMNNAPITIKKDRMAIEALNLMKEKNVSCLPVVDENVIIGTIRLQSVINAGILG